MAQARSISSPRSATDSPSNNKCCGSPQSSTNERCPSGRRSFAFLPRTGLRRISLASAHASNASTPLDEQRQRLAQRHRPQDRTPRLGILDPLPSNGHRLRCTDHHRHGRRPRPDARVPGHHRCRHRQRGHHAPQLARSHRRGSRNHLGRGIDGRALVIEPHRRGHHLRPSRQTLSPRTSNAAGLLHPNPNRCAHLTPQQRCHRRPASVHDVPVDRHRQCHQPRHHSRRDVHHRMASHHLEPHHLAVLPDSVATCWRTYGRHHPGIDGTERIDEHHDDRTLQRERRHARQAFRPPKGRG